MTIDSDKPTIRADDESASAVQQQPAADSDIDHQKKINPLFSDDADDDDYDYSDQGESESRVAWYFAGFFIIAFCTGAIVLFAFVKTDSEKARVAKIIAENQRQNAPKLINGKRAPRDTPMSLPGMFAPVTLTVEDAQVSESEPVIGVTIGEQHRAYICSAFDMIGQKVINDLVDEIPITVTYCDIYERARVFTSTERGDYLHVGLGGWMDREMFFYYQNIRFTHSTKTAPLPDYPHIITTWGQWLKEHPDSLIYLGDGVIPLDNKSFDPDKPEINPRFIPDP